MILYHCTDSADVILKNGFRDSTGNYMMTIEITGVFFSDWPLDVNEGAKGDTVLRIEIPEEKILEYEIVEEGKTFREFCIPAELANYYGPPSIVSEDDIDDLYIARFSQYQGD